MIVLPTVTRIVMTAHALSSCATSFLADEQYVGQTCPAHSQSMPTSPLFAWLLDFKDFKHYRLEHVHHMVSILASTYQELPLLFLRWSIEHSSEQVSA